MIIGYIAKAPSIEFETTYKGIVYGKGGAHFIRPGHYRGSDNTRKTWHPLQADCALPDYLLKSEYHDGIWGEQEMAIGAGTGSVILNEWTHVITILSTAPDAIAFTNVRLRAGQVITIKAAKDCTLNLIVGHGPGINHNVYKDCTYLLFNMYATESSDAGLTLTQIATPTMYVFNKTGDDLYSDDGDTTVKVDINIEAPVGCYPMIVNVVANETKAAWASKSLYVNFINGNGNQVVSTGHTINGTSPYAVASTNFGLAYHGFSAYGTSGRMGRISGTYQAFRDYVQAVAAGEQGHPGSPYGSLAQVA